MEKTGITGDWKGREHKSETDIRTLLTRLLLKRRFSAFLMKVSDSKTDKNWLINSLLSKRFFPLPTNGEPFRNVGTVLQQP